jgi:hypothetical protein
MVFGCAVINKEKERKHNHGITVANICTQLNEYHASFMCSTLPTAIFAGKSCFLKVQNVLSFPPKPTRPQMMRLHSYSCTVRARLVIHCRGYYEGAAEPFHFIPNREPAVVTPEEAVKCIKSDDRVFLHSVVATPQNLVKAMVERGRKREFKNVELVSIHTEGRAEYAEPGFEGVFRANLLFTGSNMRKHVNEGRADFTPVFLRNVPRLFKQGYLPVSPNVCPDCIFLLLFFFAFPVLQRNHKQRNKKNSLHDLLRFTYFLLQIDVALITVSPPDEHGYCSLGTSVDVSRAALQSAKTIVAFVNKQMPRTYGDGIIHKCHFNYVVYGDEPLHALPETSDLSPVEVAIGKHIAENLVEDGSTLQL